MVDNDDLDLEVCNVGVMDETFHDSNLVGDMDGEVDGDVNMAGDMVDDTVRGSLFLNLFERSLSPRLIDTEVGRLVCAIGAVCKGFFVSVLFLVVCCFFGSLWIIQKR